MAYLFVIIGIMMVSMIVYMYYYFKVTKEIRLALKLATSLWFVLLGIAAIFIQTDKNIKFSIIMLLGLIFGFLGDAVLGLRRTNSESNKAFFCVGLLAFMLGHILYSLAYFSFSSYPQYIYFLVALAVTVVLIVVVELTKVKLGYLRAPNYLYTYISSFLLTTIVLAVIDGFTLGKTLALLGIVSFISSDVILNYLYFKELSPAKFKIYKYINIVTYYVGQMLIALSIYFLM
ncbi:MAG TPA: lysoplasmalogenase family protein [Bacilli bacterium]|nr:lysoplasmalogenase family protein [Bacilli bacterium]